MRFRPAIALLTVVLALITAHYGARALVPSLGDAMAQGLARLAGSLRVPADPTRAEAIADSGPMVAIGRPAESPRTRHFDGRALRAPQTGATRAATGALDIPADRVARLTEKQLRSLRAVDGVDANGRAIGARVFGLGALGVGLADGDLVTRIDGVTTPDVSTALEAAIHAYASGEGAARATVLRDGQTLLVTVGMPPRPGIAQTL